MFLIVGVSHGILIAHDTGLCHAADEHSVSAEIYVILYFQGHECVDIFVQEHKTIIRMVDFLAGKFIHASAGLESKLLKNRERSIYGQAVYIHNSSLLDHMMGIVGFVDIDSNAVRIVCELCNRVDDKAVVFFAIIGGHHIEAVADAEQSGHIIFIGKVIAFCNVLLAELVSHCFHLFAVFLVYS